MKNLIYILLLALLVFLAIILFNNQKKQYSSNLQQLKADKEQLVKSITTLDSLAMAQENALYAKISFDSLKHLKQLDKVKADYNRDKTRIRQLPLTEQVELLETNINNSVELLTIDKDTAVILTIPDIQTVNLTYNELVYSVSELRISRTMVIDLNNSLTDAKKVIETNRSEISRFKTLSDTDNKIISELNKSILNERKIAKKRIFKTILVSGVTGIVIGSTLVTILK